MRHQFILQFAPDGTDRAVRFECTYATLCDAYMQLNGTVDRFDHFQQANVSGIAGKGHTAARPAGCMQQACDGKLGNDFRKE